MRSSRPRQAREPSLRSMVLPGQLPTCWLRPVSRLNIVDLPTLGWPARPTTRGLSAVRGGVLAAVGASGPIRGWHVMAKRFDLDFLSFVAPQRDAGAAREHQDGAVPPI